MSIEFEDMSTNANEVLLKARLEQIRELGKEGAISLEAAHEMPTSVLVMSVIKFPDLLVECGSLLQAAASDSAEALNDVHTSLRAVSESLNNCCQALDERLPSPKQSDS